MEKLREKQKQSINKTSKLKMDQKTPNGYIGEVAVSNCYCSCSWLMWAAK